MNALKMFKAVLVILVLSILTGCSDQITSTAYETNGRGGSEKPLLKVTGAEDSRQNVVPVIPTFRTYLKLKPHRSYTFNLSNTGFSKFTSIDIENLTAKSEIDRVSNDCQNLAIYGEIKSDVTLSCHSHSFNFKQITVENLSSRMLELDVTLLGIRYAEPSKNDE